MIDARSLAQLYQVHHGWLLGWLRGRIGNSSDAADLTQDTFMRLYASDGSTRVAELREPRAWLTRVAQGLVIDRARRQKLERAYLDALASLPEPETPSPEAQLLLIEALMRIDAMLDGLRPRAREVFLLSRLEGLKYPEIATRLGVCLSSVEKDMAAAIRHCHRMRRLLA